MKARYAVAGVRGGFLGVFACATVPENFLWVVPAAHVVNWASAAFRRVTDQ